MFELEPREPSCHTCKHSVIDWHEDAYCQNPDPDVIQKAQVSWLSADLAQQCGGYDPKILTQCPRCGAEMNILEREARYCFVDQYDRWQPCCSKDCGPKPKVETIECKICEGKMKYVRSFGEVENTEHHYVCDCGADVNIFENGNDPIWGFAVE